MQRQIKVKAPAKINLTLEVLDKREDGFHNIKSIMQAINLYDYLTFKVSESDSVKINLDGDSKNIPYNEKNLVWKAIVKFFEKTGLKAYVDVYIEKNIPIEAGLAGGSTDAAATFYALNKIFDYPLSNADIEELCALLGSDLNFCLQGGTAVCTGRGEKIVSIPTQVFDVSIIKPLSFGISAKEAYTKFSQLSLEEQSVPDNTEKLSEILKNSIPCLLNESFLYNSLEFAVINDYKELLEIKKNEPSSVMSGSGPTFFVLKKQFDYAFDDRRFVVINGLKSICDGVKEVC